MFLHLTVSHSVQRGVSAQVHARIYTSPRTRGRHPPGQISYRTRGRHPQVRHPQVRHPPGQTPPMSDNPPCQTPPGQIPPQVRHPSEPEVDTPPQVRHPPGQTPPRSDTSRQIPLPPPGDGHCCGQYASYWNAFLLS